MVYMFKIINQLYLFSTFLRSMFTILIWFDLDHWYNTHTFNLLLAFGKLQPTVQVCKLFNIANNNQSNIIVHGASLRTVAISHLTLQAKRITG